MQRDIEYVFVLYSSLLENTLRYQYLRNPEMTVFGARTHVMV